MLQHQLEQLIARKDELLELRQDVQTYYNSGASSSQDTCEEVYLLLHAELSVDLDRVYDEIDDCRHQLALLCVDANVSLVIVPQLGQPALSAAPAPASARSSGQPQPAHAAPPQPHATGEVKATH